MQVVCTRHSVSAGDDVDAPHRRIFTFGDAVDLPDLIAAIARSGWLPAISGGKATWSVVSGVVLAVVAQEWPEPKLLLPIDRSQIDWRGGDLVLHFNYHAQIDPEIVRRIFWGMQLKA